MKIDIFRNNFVDNIYAKRKLAKYEPRSPNKLLEVLLVLVKKELSLILKVLQR